MSSNWHRFYHGLCCNLMTAWALHVKILPPTPNIWHDNEHSIMASVYDTWHSIFTCLLCGQRWPIWVITGFTAIIMKTINTKPKSRTYIDMTEILSIPDKEREITRRTQVTTSFTTIVAMAICPIVSIGSNSWIACRSRAWRPSVFMSRFDKWVIKWVETWEDITLTQGLGLACEEQRRSWSNFN